MTTLKSWDDYPWIFKPKRELNSEELTELLFHFMKIKCFDNEFVESLPEHLKEQFVEREK